jgi:hypothetical protein
MLLASGVFGEFHCRYIKVWGVPFLVVPWTFLTYLLTWTLCRCKFCIILNPLHYRLVSDCNIGPSILHTLLRPWRQIHHFLNKWRVTAARISRIWYLLFHFVKYSWFRSLEFPSVLIPYKKIMRIKMWNFAVAIPCVLHAQSTDKEMIVNRDYIATIIVPF